jgi:3-oxoacyl-[acyl-carrier-protein] synthase-3
VAVSSSYSRQSEDSDTMTWFVGDGAAAFVVARVPEGQGVLGSKLINTVGTCGAFVMELTRDGDRAPWIRMRAGENTSRLLRDTGADYLRRACHGALDVAAVSINDVRCFVFSTPTAWYSRFAARALGVDAERTLSTYPRFANIGPGLPLVNLHEAARTGRIAAGDYVLMYGIGSVSNAGAIVMRWGDVALGPAVASARYRV